MRAVDGFDVARGNKFSTYAAWAIRNELARKGRRSMRLRSQPFALYEESLTAPDNGANEHEREEAQDRRRSVLRRWLGRLDKRERWILASRYGIGGSPEQSLTKISQELGITKERVRQIIARAHAKIRRFARHEAIEPWEI
jgi:RNA polymerase primary sigma factor